MKNEAESQAVFAVSYVRNVRGRAMLPDSNVHVKILQNNLQIKELQAAYENRKRFTISLNGTYANL